MRIKTGVMILALSCILLVGCSEKGADASTTEPHEPSTEKHTATLWMGTTQSDLRSHDWEYSGELTAEILADGLSQVVGLDFFITSAIVPDGITIDWENTSTLLANLDDQEQKEDFHFYDADSMRWFMMDSLQMTLANNMNFENVYYTMNGGQPLTFTQLEPVRRFPSELPYMRSTFYFAHADGEGGIMDGRGDPIDDDGNVIDNWSDPGDTSSPEWWGAYENTELGFSILISEYSGTDFWAEISRLPQGGILWAGRATILSENDHSAVLGGLEFRLSEDFLSLQLVGEDASEWADMRGEYGKTQ